MNNFENLQIDFKMNSPIATIGIIMLDGLLSASVAKDILGDNFYNGSNICGTKEQIDKWLGKILNKQHNVFCASAGIGDNRECITSWTKRWDDKYEDVVKFEGNIKERVDIGSGFFKGFHMPLVIREYKVITFYARGDKKEIERLLKTYIYFIGKKGSQGYGEINEMNIKIIDNDYSLFKDNKIMRPIPINECQVYIENKMKKQKQINMEQFPIIPPYWRNDNIELCIMPE